MPPLMKYSGINKENDLRAKDFYYRDRDSERHKQNRATFDDMDHLKPKEPFYDVPINQIWDKTSPGSAGQTMSFSFPTTAQMNLKVDWPYHNGPGTAEDVLPLPLPHQNKDYILPKTMDKMKDYKGLKAADRLGYYRRHSYAGHNSPGGSVASGQQITAYPVGNLSSHTSFNSSRSSNKENIFTKKHDFKIKDTLAALDPSSSTSTSTTLHTAYNQYTPATIGKPLETSHISQIHALLDARGSPLKWDVRESLSTMNVRQAAAMYFTYEMLSMPFTSSAATTVRIISKDFPWTFDLSHASGSRLKPRPISATDVLLSLYSVLHKPLEDAVWGAADEAKRDSIERAVRRRNGQDLRKVDWLGRYVMFKGFRRDDSFAKRRLHPDVKDVPETWVVAFAKP